MMHGSVQQQLEAICAGLATAPAFCDLEVLKIAIHKEHRVYHVSVTIDKDVGVDSNLCEAVSRHIERRIEELPPPVPLFTIEVASAGVERPLLRPEHYRRFKGRPINVITTLRVKNRTEFTGSIADADDNAVIIDDKYAGVTPLPYAVIKRAHLVYDPRSDLNRKVEEDVR
jgi:ribosome maturation factor RimP